MEIGDVKIEKMKEGWTVFFKQRMPDGKTSRSLVLDKGTTSSGSSLILEIFGKNIFDNPKPMELVKYFIEISTKKDDIVLDSFAGTGTTAHAVVQQNIDDDGHRKFILIETLDYAKAITAERVKRVQQGYKYTGEVEILLYKKKITTVHILKQKTMALIANEVNEIIEIESQNYKQVKKTFKENVLKVVGIKDIESFKEGLGGGFKYCELGAEIFDETGELNPVLSFDDIAKHIYFVEFKQPRGQEETDAPFVGSYKNQHLYFYEKQFRTTDLKKLVKIYEKYRQIIVYTRRCSISDDELKKHKIVIRYIPYDIKDN